MSISDALPRSSLAYGFIPAAENSAVRMDTEIRVTACALGRSVLQKPDEMPKG